MTQPANPYVPFIGLQGPPGPVSANVSSLASLATLPQNAASALAGTVVGYTPIAGGQTTYYQWAPASTATPNGSTIVAGNGGNWLIWLGTTVSVATRAALSAFPDVLLLDGAQAFNQEAGYRAKWTLDKTTTLAADGITVVATASGSGKWVLASRYSDAVPAKEVGADATGLTDCSGAINAALVALASTQADLLLSGSLLAANPINPVSKSKMRLAPGAQLKSTVTPGSVYTGSLVLFGEPTEICPGTIASNPALGATTLSVTFSGAVPTVGQFIRLDHADSSQTFAILAISGASNPYTLTLDRPVLLPFTTSDTVVCYAAILQDFTLDGGNATIGGTGDLYAELFGARRCSIENLQIGSSALGGLRASTFKMSFDIGGYQNKYRRLYIDGTGDNATVNGPTHEAGEDCLTEDVVCTNMTGNGPGFVDCISGVMNRCRTKNAPNGFGMGFGTQDVGLNHSFGCVGCMANDCESVTCQTGFVEYGPTGGFSDGNRLNRFKADSCSLSGLWVQSTSDGFVCDGLKTSNSGVQGVLVSSQGSRGTIIRNWTANEQNGNSNCATVSASTTDVLFDGFRVTSGGGAFAGAGFDISGNRTTLRDGLITLATASRIGITFRSGVLVLENVRVSTAQASTYGIFCSGSSGTIYIDRKCDFSQVATPIAIAAGFTIVVEQSGIVAVNTTTAMTFSQLQNAEIESSGNASGTVTITASVAIPGMEWTCRNNNTGTSATSFFGITVAIGKSARIRINSAGAGERVTADT